MAKKIVGSWKIDDDIAAELDRLHSELRLPKGDAVQLGIWLVCNLTLEQRAALFGSMDRREPVSMQIGGTYQPPAGRKDFEQLSQMLSKIEQRLDSAGITRNIDHKLENRSKNKASTS